MPVHLTLHHPCRFRKLDPQQQEALVQGLRRMQGEGLQETLDS